MNRDKNGQTGADGFGTVGPFFFSLFIEIFLNMTYCCYVQFDIIFIVEEKHMDIFADRKGVAR